MGISVQSNATQLPLTTIAGAGAGIAGGAVIGSKIAKAHTTVVLADAVGATLGGKLEKIPVVGGAIAGASAARALGANDVVSALAAHGGGRVAEGLPVAESALEDIAKGAKNPVAKFSASAGAAVLGEVPHVAGAVSGGHLGQGVRRAIPLGLAAIGAGVGALVATNLPGLPQVTLHIPGLD